MSLHGNWQLGHAAQSVLIMRLPASTGLVIKDKPIMMSPSGIHRPPSLSNEIAHIRMRMSCSLHINLLKQLLMLVSSCLAINTR